MDNIFTAFCVVKETLISYIPVAHIVNEIIEQDIKLYHFTQI